MSILYIENLLIYKSYWLIISFKSFDFARLLGIEISKCDVGSHCIGLGLEIWRQQNGWWGQQSHQHLGVGVQTLGPEGL